MRCKEGTKVGVRIRKWRKTSSKLFAPDKSTYGIGKELRIEFEDKMSVCLYRNV
jgi:hypothetical protein